MLLGVDGKARRGGAARQVSFRRRRLDARRCFEQKNGEKRLRSLLVKSAEWKDDEQRAKVVRQGARAASAPPGGGPRCSLGVELAARPRAILASDRICTAQHAGAHARSGSEARGAPAALGIWRASASRRRPPLRADPGAAAGAAALNCGAAHADCRLHHAAAGGALFSRAPRVALRPFASWPRA